MQSKLTILNTGKAKLYISENVWYKVFLYHTFIGDKEWSGLLFYTVTGDIQNPSEMVFTAKDIYLMDIGNDVATAYEYNEQIFDAYDANPELEKMKIGHIHTHHNMNTFFSGTDMENLEENIPYHNYFLSLIVNKSGDTSAKVAYEVNYKGLMEIKGNNGQIISAEAPAYKAMGIIDLDVLIQGPEREFNRINELKEIAKKKVEVSVPSYKSDFANYQYRQNLKEYEKKNPDKYIKVKSIFFMRKLLSMKVGESLKEKLKILDRLPAKEKKELLNSIGNRYDRLLLEEFNLKDTLNQVYYEVSDHVIDTFNEFDNSFAKEVVKQIRNLI